MTFHVIDTIKFRINTSEILQKYNLHYDNTYSNFFFIKVNGFFAVSTLNVLWGMLAGVRYSRNDADLKEILEKLKRRFRAGNPTGGLLSVLPILKYIIPGLIGYTDEMNILREIQDHFRVSNKFIIFLILEFVILLGFLGTIILCCINRFTSLCKNLFNLSF